MQHLNDIDLSLTVVGPAFETERNVPMTFVRPQGLLAFAIVLVITMPAAAQSPFTGSWQVDANPGWTAVLRVNGTQVAGKVSQCSSQVSADILEGAVDGDSITLKCQSPDGSRLLTLRGTLRKDEILFTWSMAVKPGGAPADVNVRGREGILVRPRPQSSLPVAFPTGRSPKNSISRAGWSSRAASTSSTAT